MTDDINFAPSTPSTEVAISSAYFSLLVRNGVTSKFRTLAEALDHAEMNGYHAFRVLTEDGTEVFAQIPVQVYATSDHGGPLTPSCYRAAW